VPTSAGCRHLKLNCVASLLVRYFQMAATSVPPSFTSSLHQDIRHTVRYTALSPKPFRDFWRD
jgi:hypothetical protein